MKVLLAGGRSLSDAVWSIHRGFERLGIEVRHIPTRRAGTKYDPLEDIEGVFSDVIDDFRPNVLVWVMCKYDCPKGFISFLKAKYPSLLTVFHSFDDPEQIDATGAPWARDFDCAITCCKASLEYYRGIGTPAVCLYPPADRELHGRARPDVGEYCDISFAATNVYTPSLFPHALVPRTELVRKAAAMGKLHLYGPWERTRSTWGGQFGAPELIECHRGQKKWREMPTIYTASKINLNSHNRPEAYGYINERTIHCLASGGLLLSDAVSGIEEEFVPDEEIVVWSDIEEFEDKLRFLRTNPEVRRRIAAAGKRKALANHDNVRHNERLIEFLRLHS